MLQITVNGETVTLKEGLALSRALETLGHQGAHFAVAINGDFVPRDRYHHYRLQAGDALEVLSPMQGG